MKRKIDASALGGTPAPRVLVEVAHQVGIGELKIVAAVMATTMMAEAQRSECQLTTVERTLAKPHAAAEMRRRMVRPGCLTIDASSWGIAG